VVVVAAALAFARTRRRISPPPMTPCGAMQSPNESLSSNCRIQVVASSQILISRAHRFRPSGAPPFISFER
jgi:hypothetical protein